MKQNVGLLKMAATTHFNCQNSLFRLKTHLKICWATAVNAHINSHTKRISVKGFYLSTRKQPKRVKCILKVSGESIFVREIAVCVNYE